MSKLPDSINIQLLKLIFICLKWYYTLFKLFTSVSAEMSFTRSLSGQETHFINKTYPNHVTVFSMSPKKKKKNSIPHNGLPRAPIQIPITESQGGNGRLWLASLWWSSPFEGPAISPYRQQMHNNDFACGAMDTRLKGPETMNYNP
jgi:hypothetical protein